MPMDAPLLNITAPNFILPDLEGNLHRLDGYRGYYVILNFWSAECPWSARTDQELNAALTGWDQVSKETHIPLVLLPIAPNMNESLEMLVQTASERNLPLVLRDKGNHIANLYGAQTTPHFFLIDPDGILRYQGAFDDVTFRKRTPTKYYLKDAVDALLRGDTPDPCITPAYGCSIVSFAE